MSRKHVLRYTIRTLRTVWEYIFINFVDYVTILCIIAGDVLYLNRYHIVALNADYAQSTFYD